MVSEQINRTLDWKVVFWISIAIAYLAGVSWITIEQSNFSKDVEAKINKPFERAVQSLEPSEAASQIKLGIAGTFEVLDTIRTVNNY